MLSALLAIIYLAFISLGLPDGSFGSAWPNMYEGFDVPVSYAGFFTVLAFFGTMISSLLSARILKKFGTGKVVLFSAILTSSALIGLSFAPSFIWVCVLAVPLGIGGGAVDVSLNSFVALHYETKHMNWLHCFWGIGATLGPYIMSYNLASVGGYRKGYMTIGLIQACLAFILFLSLPLWKKVSKTFEEEKKNETEVDLKNLIKVPGAKFSLLAFFSYCSIEVIVGTWLATYLVLIKDIDKDVAARWISVFFLGITIMRFISGFISMKLSNISIIRLGQYACALGVILFIFPINSSLFYVISIMLIGLGCAPIFPSMIAQTPHRFGEELSQGLVGIQMASAYLGSAIAAPIFGIIAKHTSFSLFSYCLLIFVIVMIVSTELINRITKKS